MNLSKLIAYKNGIDQQTLAQQIKAFVDHAAQISNDLHMIDAAQQQHFQETVDAATYAAQQTEQALNGIKEWLQREFESQSKQYYIESEARYEREKTYDSPDYIQSRALTVAPAERELARARLATYVSWQYPALEIRPYCSGFTDLLVGCDPLYLLDQNPELTRLAAEQFVVDYQRRICCYTYNEHSNKFLSELPENQFGLILATNYFERLSFEVAKQVLHEAWGKLRPGGTFIFTVNNCDRSIAAQHAEAGYASFIPGSILQAYAERTGFECVFSFDITNSSTWYEFKKPGQLESLRGGQSLAKIVDRRYLTL